MFNIIALVICIVIITILYDKYIQKYKNDPELELYNKLQDYLLNKSKKSKNPLYGFIYHINIMHEIGIPFTTAVLLILIYHTNT